MIPDKDGVDLPESGVHTSVAEPQELSRVGPHDLKRRRLAGMRLGRVALQVRGQMTRDAELLAIRFPGSAADSSYPFDDEVVELHLDRRLCVFQTTREETDGADREWIRSIGPLYKIIADMRNSNPPQRGAPGLHNPGAPQRTGPPRTVPLYVNP